MRVLTWNMNGIRSVVSKSGTIRAALESLEADVVCLQETKVRRSELDRELAIVEGWESFWVFSSNKTGPGYAGVATFCRTSTASVPVAVEHGLTGTAAAGRPEVSSSNASSEIRHLLSEALGLDVEQLAALDSEGRALITDHGPFLLVNLYGPALTSEERVEERLPFKLNFYRVLEWRLRRWVAAGRAVLVVGDLNISPQAIDSCKPHPLADFERRPDRVWFRQLLGPHGPGVTDVFRSFHPDRGAAYTCWNVASGARVHNYGTRIDHILAAGPVPHQFAARESSSHGQQGCSSKEHGNGAGMMPGVAAGTMAAAVAEQVAQVMDQQATASTRRFTSLITGCDIMHDYQGSDHAPVWADLDIPVHVMPSGHAAPAAAASRMFPGKQASLQAWLQPKQQQQQQQQQQQDLQLDNASVQVPHVPSTAEANSQRSAQGSEPFQHSRGPEKGALSGGCHQSSNGSAQHRRGSSTSKRSISNQVAGSNKRGQTSLLGFMKPPVTQQQCGNGVGSSSSSGSSRVQGVGSASCEHQQSIRAASGFTGRLEPCAQLMQQQQQHWAESQHCAGTSAWPSHSHPPGYEHCQQQEVLLPQQQPQHLQTQHQQGQQQQLEQGIVAEDVAASLQKALADQRKQTAAAWQRITQAMQPPKCLHREVCVVRTCKKQNDNYLRQFYCCARPDGPFPGPGRCCFFKWVTEPKKTKGSEPAAPIARAVAKHTSRK